MSGLSRRSLFTAAAAAGLASAVPEAGAGVVLSRGGIRLEDNPAARASGAQFQPDPMPAPELPLSNTFSLGKSTINESEVITASRWGVVRAHVQGGKMTHLTPFEHD